MSDQSCPTCGAVVLQRYQNGLTECTNHHSHPHNDFRITSKVNIEVSPEPTDETTVDDTKTQSVLPKVITTVMALRIAMVCRLGIYSQDAMKEITLRVKAGDKIPWPNDKEGSCTSDAFATVCLHFRYTSEAYEEAKRLIFTVEEESDAPS